MPKRTDLKSILIIGAGPIVIGQACEFDYAGTQACKALREEGYRVILVNSNPATIMTDPAMADATYIEPLDVRTLTQIIAQERPDALLPTMGGQTALNCALALDEQGVLKEYQVALIGANREAIEKAEKREQFIAAMGRIGLSSPRSMLVRSLDEAQEFVTKIGFPNIIRPSLTLGGSGSGIAHHAEEFADICRRGLALSPVHEVLIDESLIGWKEFELEVVRDRADNCIIVCAIENLDPMGVHTGDSITVAPAQTLTDKEYQILRNAAIAILREIDVDTGGSNVQFAINPRDGRMVVIEMNPRVSRSSALASKATGFPIARVAAKLAVGYTLDELRNEITGGVIPASFEPALDYVVTKIPRFTFEKFPQSIDRLNTQMQSVGEAMAIGRNFQQSLQKALRSLENGHTGLDSADYDQLDNKTLAQRLKIPSSQRLWEVAAGLRRGWSLERLYALTAIDPWFLGEIADLIDHEKRIAASSLADIDSQDLHRWKRLGFADARLAQLLDCSEAQIREQRQRWAIHPVFKHVDSCAGEFASTTAYLYSSYDEENEALPDAQEKIMVLGSGPNRIGQGIEFDYCCVHAAFAMRAAGYQSIMVNCNPETVSTDFDISDRLYFEPLTVEDILEIVRLEKPRGVIVQFGGQTPLSLAPRLAALGVPILGTSPDAIDRAEDRERFQILVAELGLQQPDNGIANHANEAFEVARKVGYPLVVRPSYVLGGRAMQIVYDDAELQRFLVRATRVAAGRPILLDHFLQNAIEVDVDAVCDGNTTVIGGVMQHIEQAGIHSGDSSCALPTYNLSSAAANEIRRQTHLLAAALEVVGLINIQFAIQGEQVYLLEVNPRASRTIPFVSKVIGVSLAQIAARCMLGSTLKEQGFETEIIPVGCTIKEAVFPFHKFPGVDPLLGPEMKSTGEVMGRGKDFAEAFAKAQAAAGNAIPHISNNKNALSAFLCCNEEVCFAPGMIKVAKDLQACGWRLMADQNTQVRLQEAQVHAQRVGMEEDARDSVADIFSLLADDQIHLVINIGGAVNATQQRIRRLALQRQLCYVTTLAAAEAFCAALHCSPESWQYRALGNAD